MPPAVGRVVPFSHLEATVPRGDTMAAWGHRASPVVAIHGGRGFAVA